MIFFPSASVDGKDAQLSDESKFHRYLQQRAIVLIAIAGIGCAIVAQCGWVLIRYWIDVQDYNYGFLILAVAVVWFWQQRREIASLALAPVLWPLPVLIAVWLMWYALWQGHSELGSQLLIPVMLWLPFVIVVGLRSAIVILWPISYLYFSIPIWDELLPLLQQTTIFGAKVFMAAAGVPMSIVGNKLAIAEGTFQVLYSCSGLRYLVVSLALAFLLGVIDRMRPVRFVALMATTAALAILANWARVFIVMYAGHVTGMSHYFVSDSHQGLGNVIFGVLLFAIYGASRLLLRGTSGAPASTANEIAHPPAALRSWVIPLLLVTMILMAGLSIRTAFASTEYLPPKLQPPPFLADVWQGPMPSASGWMPVFKDAADAQRYMYSYTAHGESKAVERQAQIEVYVNAYGQQQQGLELVYFQNTLLAPGDWRTSGARDLGETVNALLGSNPLVGEYTVRDERWLIGQLYVVGTHRTSNGFMEQVLYGLSTMSKPTPAGVIAVAIRCANDCNESRMVLDEFWRTLGDALVGTIPRNLREAGP